MSQSLCFNDVQFDVIPQNSQPWVRGYQIGTALGYGENADVSIRKLYTRHADEFTPAMTAVVTLPTEGGPQETRIFSLRGCHLLAMFARTPVAKAFRKWCLDVIEQYGDRVPVAEPVTLNDELISAAERAELKLIVDAKLSTYPAAVQGKARAEIWAKFNRHFRIAEYKQLPTRLMSVSVPSAPSPRLRPRFPRRRPALTRHPSSGWRRTSVPSSRPTAVAISFFGVGSISLVPLFLSSSNNGPHWGRERHPSRT